MLNLTANCVAFVSRDEMKRSPSSGSEYLEEAELIRSLVRTDNHGLDITNVDIAASNGESFRSDHTLA